MKLTVIIPVFNGENFIEKSYYSILDQNLKDFEILYVDNNSKDASVEKIKKLIKEDFRVKLLKQTKQGAAPARNLGITNAKGDYVYLFDVDDEIFPNALTKMISVLDDYLEAEAVFGKMIKSNKGILETYKPNDESHEIIIKDKPFWGLEWFTDLSKVVGPPAFLYRKSVFETIGTYNEEVRIGEDTALDIKLGMSCKIAFLDTYIYLYKKHSKSTIEIAKKNDSLVSIHWLRFVKCHLPFYLKNEVPTIYKELLFSYLFKTIGKQLHCTIGFGNRNILRKKLIEDIKPIKLPFILNAYLLILTLFPFSYLLKIYVYYLVPLYIKKFKNYSFK